MSGVAKAPIAAYRGYGNGKVASGQAALFIEAASPDGPPLEQLMASGDVITEDEIRTWSGFLSFALAKSDIRELMLALNLMRVTVYVDDATPFHLKQSFDRVRDNLNGLLADLPKLMQFTDEYRLTNKRAGIISDSYGALLKSAKETYRLVPPKAPPGRSAQWHNDAAWLAWILQRAADRAGKQMSFTKGTAPAVVFIDNALTRAAVKHQNPSSIAREMARYQSKFPIFKALSSQP